MPARSPGLTAGAARFVPGGVANGHSGGYRPGPPQPLLMHGSPGQGNYGESASQVGSELDNDGDGPKIGDHKPSHKVHAVAGDIAALEQRCNWLEERNVWLTKRLLQAQRRFIERSLLATGKVIVTRSFEGWVAAMNELRLEKQLDEQTRSLDECQRVAQELGAALTQEQHVRSQCEAAHYDAQEELQKALDEERMLKGQCKDGQRRMELVERRVHEAENCLVRCRAEAQAVVDAANAYERTRREMEDQHKHPSRPENVLEEGLKSRKEAHTVMQKVTGLLQQRPGLQVDSHSPLREEQSWFSGQ